MKRINNLFDQICTAENIELADKKARKSKGHRWGIMKHDANKEEDNKKLLEQLKNLTYKTSSYDTYTIYEPKERLIYRLPYYPDRIVHHAIMNVLEPIWKKIFIDQTYSSIKDKGIHACAKDVKKALQDKEHTTYCLKLDIHKFYPSINHKILKQVLRKKIKDKKLLVLLDEIVDSAPGVPIGNYLSQFFANLYLSYFDHWLKEEVKCKYYFRYADDIVILHNDKNFLHIVLYAIKNYLKNNLKLELKPNYQIFPVDSRGIDFVGYKFYHTHTLLRKDIKMRMFKLLHKYELGKITLDRLKICMQSYFGWLKYCDSKKLLNKIEKITGLHYSNFIGEESSVYALHLGKTIKIINIQFYKKYYKVEFIQNGKSYFFKSTNKALFTQLYKNIRKYEKSEKSDLGILSSNNLETWKRFLLL